MPYKLLTNVIAPNQIQHLTNEIVDIEDGELAKSLVERGLVESTDSAATHYWTKKASVSAGGLPINAAAQPAAPEPSGTSQLNAAKVAEAEEAPAQPTDLPEQSNPVPEAPSKASGLASRVKSAVTGQTTPAQPTNEEVAQTAAEVS